MREGGDGKTAYLGGSIAVVYGASLRVSGEASKMDGSKQGRGRKTRDAWEIYYAGGRKQMPRKKK